MNKLFERGCLGRLGAHGKHMTLRDLTGGYDPKYHGMFQQAVRELRSEGLVDIFPARTGTGTDEHIVAIIDRLHDARALMNAYRRSVGLRPLRPDLREFP
jgi:predicted NAD/FAD-dependent oxidoreductase